MKALYTIILTVIALVALYPSTFQCQQRNIEKKWEKESATPFEDSSFLDYNKKLGGIVNNAPSGKYSIVVGAFRHEEYARKKEELCNKAGYAPELVKFGNGMIAVILSPTDSLEYALLSLNELKNKGICPADGWILTKE